MAYITITPQSDITYVAGTINSVPTVWEEINGQWYGYADAVEDGNYHIWVEMYDKAGNRSEYTDTIHYDLPWFLTDRTQRDVDEGTSKGFLNASDLSRIEKNNAIIGKLIAVPVGEGKEWHIGDLPRTSDFARILSVVRRIRDYASRTTTPAVPEQPVNSWQKVNAIEQIQKDCFELYTSNKKMIVYAGEIYAGEGGLL